ncbi:MAG TPA: hypothetical protein DCG39_07120 [Opitutae bacterium]|nr:hypothetical protein [Opitutae bacterium]
MISNPASVAVRPSYWELSRTYFEIIKDDSADDYDCPAMGPFHGRIFSNFWSANNKILSSFPHFLRFAQLRPG